MTMLRYYEDSHVTLYHGDCMDVLATLPDASVDAVVTDPPYGLEFMGRDWDAPWKASSVGRGVKVAEQRSTPGGAFLASRVDSVRVAGKPFQAWCEQWAAECLRVLKPGGHMVAFGGTRTFHRLTAGIEDAGFEIRDVLSWLYGSGFPKSMDVSKAIDKRGGNSDLDKEIAAAIRDARESRGWSVAQADRHFCGGTTNWTWFEGRKGDCRPPTPATFARIVFEWPELAPWAEKVAEAERVITREATRDAVAGETISFDQRGSTERERRDIPALDVSAQWSGWGTALKPAWEPIILARKPLAGTVAGNVLAHGTGAINIDACRVAATEEDLALMEARSHPNGTTAGARGGSIHMQFDKPEGFKSNPAGRFPANVLMDEEAGAALDEQSGIQRDGVAVNRNRDPKAVKHASIYGMYRNGERPDISYGSGGGASRFFYSAKADSNERPLVDGVAHPTVKPLALMEWLIRLVTPPGGTILDPFAGSGATLEAAQYTGHQAIGIEKGDEYLPLILHRLERSDPRIKVSKPPEAHPDQLDLLTALGGIA